VTFIQVAPLDHLTVSGTGLADGANHNTAPLAVDRTGQWICVWRLTNSSPTSLLQCYIQAFANGTQVTFSNNTSADGSSQSCVFWQGSMVAGQVFANLFHGNGAVTMTCVMDAYFIPTPGASH
jgi:hypothetical protein